MSNLKKTDLMVQEFNPGPSSSNNVRIIRGRTEQNITEPEPRELTFSTSSNRTSCRKYDRMHDNTLRNLGASGKFLKERKSLAKPQIREEKNRTLPVTNQNLRHKAETLNRTERNSRGKTQVSTNQRKCNESNVNHLSKRTANTKNPKTFNARSILYELKSVVQNKGFCNMEKIAFMISKCDLNFKDDIIADILQVTYDICSIKSTNKEKLMLSLYQIGFLTKIHNYILTKLYSKLVSEKQFSLLLRQFIILSRWAVNCNLPDSSLTLLRHILALIKTMEIRLQNELDYIEIEELIYFVDEKVKKNELKKQTALSEVNRLRCMSIIPTQKDLFGGPPDLKRNIVAGAYKHTGHYLIVQFTLLHEDFIAPLREGITEYLSSLKTGEKKKSKVAVFRCVKILSASTASGKLCHIVKLDKTTKWESVLQFFIYGSLLLFTTNHFKSFFLGIVINVCNKDRTVMVKFHSDHSKVCEDLYAEDFVMAVSKVFFEPYFHVLTALQNMVNEEFPMKKYVVEVNPNPKPPSYISQLKISTYKIFGETSVKILEPNWPQLSEVQLNPSQHRAFKAALTNEFVAIQGPPGTGKTFLGLQIVSTLLDNVDTGTPILVVCYKNHALDQFLEKILNKTKDIIRIGGRSKNETVNKFNLKDCRGPYGYDDHRKVLQSLAQCYFQKQNDIDGLKKHGIVSVWNVQPYIKCHKFKSELMNTNFEEWLMEGAYVVQQRDVLLETNNVGFWNEIQNETEIRDGESHEMLPHMLKGLSLQEHEQSETGNEDQSDTEDIFESLKVEETNESAAVFPWSEESEKRITETFIDDYSDVYKNIIDEDSTNFSRYQEYSSTLSHNLTPQYTLTIPNLKEYLNACENQLEFINSYQTVDEIVQYQIEIINEEINDIKSRLLFLTRILKENHNSNDEVIEELYKISQQFGVWSLTIPQRWALYHSWLNSFARDIRGKMIKLEEFIRYEENLLDEARGWADLQVLKNAKVVGMTTTGAAKFRPILNKLGAKIVVIEEAAEVLESHIVSSLSSQCQHLILIGDHKQLRPNPAVYELCTKYNFDVSLFERMVRNGLSCYTLDVQHRMRPEFASLIVPSVYPDLTNHASTEGRPDILGVHRNLFFINHSHSETQTSDSDSRENDFEANYVIGLASYLLKQGYSDEDVTILATYAGQVRRIIKLRNKLLPTKKDLRISSVDEFQGEENKIIILSLVRSNNEGKIGFLKTENRVCVALSRAREGFYIVGNMECLTKNVSIWPYVKERLLQHKALGNALSVYCQNHPETVILVKDGGKLQEIPEGGCQLMCDTKLRCGHICKYHCHPRDQEHRDMYMCPMPCKRIRCKFQHPCTKLCGEDCGDCMYKIEHYLQCGHKLVSACSSKPSTLKCKTVVPCILPSCGHEATKLCSETVREAAKRGCKSACGWKMTCSHPCPLPCHGSRTPHAKVCKEEIKVTAPCGHQVMKKCANQRAPTNCYQIREKTLTCSHTVTVPCHLYNHISKCSAEVERTLECGHKLLAKCSKAEVICYEMVSKLLPCGHYTEGKCGLPLTDLVCKEICGKTLGCGHPCEMLCSESCTCSVLIEEELPCGHEVIYLCGTQNVTCGHPCQHDLPCGHVCKEKCGVPCDVTKCEQLVEFKAKATCGHMPVIIPCCISQMENKMATGKLVEEFCKGACNKMLPCGHICSGLCSSCRTQHEVCRKLCSKILPCGHQCKKKCQEECGECFENCINRCSHRKCDRICGEPCNKCQEPCERGCVHKRCSRLCFMFCDRRSCLFPCPFLLDCGHPCLGFCGELCPKLCLRCNPGDVLAVGGDTNSRFVVLEDCGHIVEAARMDSVFHRNTSCIVKCPMLTCQKPIVTTKRYHNEVRQAFINITNVKRDREAKKRENSGVILAHQNLERMKINTPLQYTQNNMHLWGSTLSNGVNGQKDNSNLHGHGRAGRKHFGPRPNE